MNINIEQWHANIALFNLNYKGIISKNCTYMNTVNYKIIILLFMFFMLLLTHGDIKSNPRPLQRNLQLFFTLSLEC